MSANDVRDDIDTELASEVGTSYADWDQRATFKGGWIQGLANALWPYFSGSGSGGFSEIPALPSTTFSSSPADQYVTDPSSGRIWSSYWDNAIGTLTISGAGVFTHAPNLGVDQQLLNSTNRAPRLWTTVPWAKSVTLEATVSQSGTHTLTSGFAQTGLAVWGRDVVTGAFGFVLIQLTKAAGPVLVVRTILNFNGSNTLIDSDSVSSAYYTTGTDLRMIISEGRVRTSFRLAGSGSGYTAHTPSPLGRVAPEKAMIFLGHDSGLSGTVSLTAKPTLIYVEV